MFEILFCKILSYITVTRILGLISTTTLLIYLWSSVKVLIFLNPIKFNLSLIEVFRFVKNTISIDGLKIIKHFKSSEDDSIDFIVAKTGKSLVSQQKTAMGFNNCSKQAQQCASFEKELSYKEKEALQELKNKYIVEETENFSGIGSFARVKLTLKYRRTRKQIDTIKQKNRKIILPKINTLVWHIGCPVCKTILSRDTNNDIVCENFDGMTSSKGAKIFRHYHLSSNSEHKSFTKDNNSYVFVFYKKENYSDIELNNDLLFKISGNVNQIIDQDHMNLVNLLQDNEWHINRKWIE